MIDVLKQKINEALESENQEELLLKLQKILNKATLIKTQTKTVTLEDCARLALYPNKPRFFIDLKSKPLQPLGKWFKLSPGLHVIAAPSGHGKTLWALQYAKEAAAQGFVVSFLSLEMTPEDLGCRILADLSELSLQQLASGQLSETQKILLENIIEDSKFLKLIKVDHYDSLDWTKISPRLWDHMIRDKPKLVIIDFIQMIYDSTSEDSRLSFQLSQIARQLKMFADQTDSAVLLLSQMNRDAIKEYEKAKWNVDGVPLTSSGIKESAGIVEAADSVQLVCIPSRFNHLSASSFENKFQVRIDKNRKFGELGTTLLSFNLSCGKFLEHQQP